MTEPLLSQRVMLVTGASGGLGSAISAAASAEGARLAILDRDRAALDELAARLGSSGADALPVECDVTDEDSVGAALSRTVDHFGRLDILVNNAGIFRMAGITEGPTADWHASLAVNLTGPYLMSRAAVAHWQAAGLKGHIINIASVGARFGFPDLTAYCASKAGLAGFSRALAEELRPSGSRVTVIYPHAMNTGQPRSVPEGADRFKIIEPETVAGLVVQAAAAPAWASVEEIVVSPQANSTTPRMIEPGHK
jgi:NAD(P)-dependent dehydrogenase (short-subunit alcohol dehydrogenase family)